MVGPVPNNGKHKVVQQVDCQSLDKLEPTEEKPCFAQLGIRSCNCQGGKEGRQVVSAEGGVPCPRKPELCRCFSICGEQWQYVQ